MGMEGNDGIRRSIPFRVEDITICDGGVESSAILWEDQSRSSYFAYRKLSLNNQSEIHIIPEFVLFNGGNECVRVKQVNGYESVIDPGKMAPMYYSANQKSNLFTSFHFITTGGITTPIQINVLGLKVTIVKSVSSCRPIGSIAVQTIIGKGDSRFVIKLGSLKLGGIAGKSNGIFSEDLLRFRIKWSEMNITLNDTAKITKRNFESYQASLRQESIPSKNDQGELFIKARPKNNEEKLFSYAKVARIVFYRFTMDFQRIFKDKTVKQIIDSPVRSQFAIIIQNIHIIDCTQQTEKVVLQSSSDKSNVFDLCIRTRGSEESGMVHVSLFDLKLAHGGKKADLIIVNTREEFLWLMIDITNRTVKAASKKVDFELDWDEENEEFNLKLLDNLKEQDALDKDGTYHPPQSDKLVKFDKITVSPTSFLFTFKRRPQRSRYKPHHNVKGAKLMNYFTKNLKFTVQNAQLNFPGFRCNSIKGPPDRLVEILIAFYSSCLKTKLINLLSATSIDDWNSLSGREDGNEQYLEGDVLRVTGNMAGKSAGFILKQVGQGIGTGIVGAGVNSVVSGIGGGVGDTIKGVGTGSSKILQSAGKSVGQIGGRVFGGVEQVAKGIEKGVTSGDGKSVLTGFGDGGKSIGSGIIGGAESLVIRPEKSE